MQFLLQDGLAILLVTNVVIDRIDDREEHQQIEKSVCVEVNGPQMEQRRLQIIRQSPVGESLALPGSDNNDSQELGERRTQSEHPAHRIKFLTESVRDQHQQIKLARFNECGEDSIDPGAAMR